MERERTSRWNDINIAFYLEEILPYLVVDGHPPCNAFVVLTQLSTVKRFYFAGVLVQHFADQIIAFSLSQIILIYKNKDIIFLF